MGNTQSSSSSGSVRSRGVDSRSGHSLGSRNTQAKHTRIPRLLKHKHKPTTSSGTFGSLLEGTSLSGLSTRTGPLTSWGTYASEITEVEKEEGEPESTFSRVDPDVPTVIYKNPALDLWLNAAQSSNPQSDIKSLEADRQTRLHHMLKFVLKSNSFAPISNPTNILDCGCGIGNWSVDIGQEYKNCTSIGLDIFPPTATISPNLNKNVSYVEGDINEPLKFEDNFFDLINQRDMVPCVEPKGWVQTLTEYKRVLKPGGWVQLVERDYYFYCDHPAVQPMNKFFKHAFSYLSIDPLVCHKMDKLVAEAGFVNITKRIIEIPIGEWDDREGFAHIGFINRSYLKTALKVSKTYLMKVNNATSDQYDKLSTGVLETCEKNRGYQTFIIVYGQKRTVE